MKTQRPPKLYGETVRPLLVDCHPNWNEKEISDAVQKNWDRASNDIKMIYQKVFFNHLYHSYHQYNKYELLK